MQYALDLTRRLTLETQGRVKANAGAFVIFKSIADEPESKSGAQTYLPNGKYDTASIEQERENVE